MHPGLNLINLRYFYDAVETESISEAARRNFVTQSAVSQGIQKLEKALNVPLMTHQRNCFKLTPEGQITFSLTQQIFTTLKVMSDAVQQQADIVTGQINVICTQSVAMNLLCSVLQKCKLRYPQVSIKMKISKMENVRLQLKRGSMDLGVVVDSPACDTFERHVIKEGYFHLYAKNGALSEGVYVDHLDGLFVDKLSALYRKRFKKPLIILQELDSWEVLARCAENGIGYCFFPDFLLNSKRYPDLKVCDSISPIPYRIAAIHPQGVHLTRAAKVFLQLLAEEATPQKSASEKRKSNQFR